MRVSVYQLTNDGEDVKIGEIHWDGRHFSMSPDVPLLRRILSHPICGPGGKALRAEEAPKEFLAALHLQYRSAYLR